MSGHSIYSDHAIQLLKAAEGMPLHHDDRCPSEPLDERHVLAALKRLERFAAWSPPPGSLPEAETCWQQTTSGMLPPADRAAYEFLCAFVKTRVTVHGDAIPSNFLLTENRFCTLIDFEHTAVGPPGWDHATFRTALSGQPAELLEQIDEWAERKAGRPGYVTGLVTTTAREMFLHHHVFPPDPSGRRKRLVSAAWDHALHRMRTLAMTRHIYRLHGDTNAKP